MYESECWICDLGESRGKSQASIYDTIWSHEDNINISQRYDLIGSDDKPRISIYVWSE